MPQLRDLDYPQIRDAMQLFAGMPPVNECMNAWLQHMQGIVTPQQIQPMAAALREYHENVAHLYKDLRQHVQAIQTYGAEPANNPNAIDPVAFARIDVENQLKDVGRVFGDVTRELDAFKQIPGTPSLQFTQRMTRAVDAVGPRLDQEIQRVNVQQLDPYEFDEQYRAQRELVSHALTRRGRRLGPHNPMPGPKPGSPLRNEVRGQPAPEPGPQPTRSRGR